MKNVNKIVCGLLVILIISMACGCSKSEKKYSINNQEYYWNIYDQSLENIKNNMDEIMSPSENFEWGELKDFEIDDKDYQDTLNRLAVSIRMEYIELTDNGDFYSNNNYVRNFRNSNVITESQLNDLILYTNSENVSNRFSSYSTFVISSDEVTRNNFINVISKIDDFYNTFDEDATYEEILEDKVIHVLLLEDVSDFLLSEYLRLK